MALTRTMLKAMDIEKENIDKIIEAHTETVDALKEARDEYKEKADKADKLQSDYDSLKEAMIDQSEYDSLKTKYDKLKDEFTAYKNDISEKDKKASKTEAYKKLLKDAGVSEKRIGAVLKVSDLNTIELNEDGSIKDADKLRDGIKEEWAEFIETTTTKGAKTENPPSNNGGSAMTKEQILAIKDTSERQRAMAENHELFGIE